MKLKRFWIIMLSFLMLIGAFELSREAVMAKPRKKTEAKKKTGKKKKNNQWKKVYLEAIERGEVPEFSSGYLIDVNRDGFPEMIIAPLAGKNYEIIYMLKNNKIKEIGRVYEDTNGSISVKDNIIIITEQSGIVRADFYTTYILLKKDGSFRELKENDKLVKKILKKPSRDKEMVGGNLIELKKAIEEYNNPSLKKARKKADLKARKAFAKVLISHKKAKQVIFDEVVRRRGYDEYFVYSQYVAPKGFAVKDVDGDGISEFFLYWTMGYSDTLSPDNEEVYVLKYDKGKVRSVSYEIPYDLTWYKNLHKYRKKILKAKEKPYKGYYLVAASKVTLKNGVLTIYSKLSQKDTYSGIRVIKYYGDELEFSKNSKIKHKISFKIDKNCKLRRKSSAETMDSEEKFDKKAYLSVKGELEGAYQTVRETGLLISPGAFYLGVKNNKIIFVDSFYP